MGDRRNVRCGEMPEKRLIPCKTGKARKGSSEGTAAIAIKIGMLLVGLLAIAILVLFASGWGQIVIDIFTKNPLIKAAIIVRDTVLR